MPDFFELVIAEMDARLRELGDAKAEYERLVAARSALGNGPASTAAATGRRRRPGSPPVRAGSKPRARRGRQQVSNKDAIIRFLRELGRPATAGELANGTGRNRGAISTMASSMAKSGELVKAEKGYALPPETATAAS